MASQFYVIPARWQDLVFSTVQSAGSNGRVGCRILGFKSPHSPEAHLESVNPSQPCPSHKPIVRIKWLHIAGCFLCACVPAYTGCSR